METMTDSEVLARLIYRAYIAPDPHAPLEAEALLPFRAALDLYARTWRGEDADVSDAAEGCGDCCPVELPEDVPGSDTAEAPKLDGFEPVPLRAHDTHTHTAGAVDGGGVTPSAFAGKGSGEKTEIYARLMAFVAAHGLGARRKIAEASNGALFLGDVQDMTDAKRVPLAKWRGCAAAMDWIEAEEARR